MIETMRTDLGKLAWRNQTVLCVIKNMNTPLILIHLFTEIQVNLINITKWSDRIPVIST